MVNELYLILKKKKTNKNFQHIFELELLLILQNLQFLEPSEHQYHNHILKMLSFLLP